MIAEMRHMFKSENAKFQLCESPTMAIKQAMIPAKIELRRRLGRLFRPGRA
jgi:hypothetical protein